MDLDTGLGEIERKTRAELIVGGETVIYIDREFVAAATANPATARILPSVAS